MISLSWPQQRALRKLREEWVAVGDLRENEETLDALVSIGIAEKHDVIPDKGMEFFDPLTQRFYRYKA